MIQGLLQNLFALGDARRHKTEKGIYMQLRAIIE